MKDKIKKIFDFKNKSEDEKKIFIIFCSGLVMVIMLAAWLVNFSSFISLKDRKVAAENNLDLSAAKTEFDRAMDKLTSRLNVLSQKREAESQKSKDEVSLELKKIADSLENKIVSESTSSKEIVIDELKAKAATEEAIKDKIKALDTQIESTKR
jgi:hypothetical protein